MKNVKEEEFSPHKKLIYVLHIKFTFCELFTTSWSRPSQFAGDRTHEWGCARLFLTKFSATTPPSKMLLPILWKKYFLNWRNFRKSANFSISTRIYRGVDFWSIFTKFWDFLGFSENRDFLQILTDRGWAYELWHIGGQKKAIFYRFCEVLPIFFQFFVNFGRKWERDF